MQSLRHAPQVVAMLRGAAANLFVGIDKDESLLEFIFAKNGMELRS